MQKRFFQLILVVLFFIFSLDGANSQVTKMPLSPQGDTAQEHQVTEEEVKGILEKYLLHNFPWERERVRIKRISYSGTLPRLSQGFTYEVNTTRTSSPLKRTPFTLSFKVGEKNLKTLIVNADIEVLVDILLTARPLKRSQVLGPEDVYVGQRDLTGLSGNILSDVDAVVGKRVKRPVGADMPLTEEMIEETPVLRRGDQVLIIAESAGLRITAVGVALGEGYLGKPIQVMNIASKKRMSGKVMDSETVKVE
jgi:flagella basal body P-ring formation protein FlgA